ncbi:hypothetical protein DYB38_013044, partial [Aphanomyces astaci]
SVNVFFSYNSSYQRTTGAFFYGLGTQAFVCDFLAQNTSTRQRTAPWISCQRDQLLGHPVVEVCTWIEALDECDDVCWSPKYAVYHAGLLWESVAFAWVKLGLRCMLVGIIWRQLWVSYFSHYSSLIVNLTTLGLPRSGGGDDYVGDTTDSYVLHVGDPTWLILSHPFVSLAMVVDCFASASYMGVAGNRVSQVGDAVQFVLGCLYGSRLAWVAYLTMHVASWPIKRWHLEEYFDPVDSGWMAISSSVYAGPIMWLATNSILMVPFQGMFTFLVAAPLETSEISTGRHRRELESFASMTKFNDLKQRVVLGSCRYIIYRGRDEVINNPPLVRKGGGGLHRLVESHCQYKWRPLFCTRAADCFVECMNDHAAVEMIRLSLIHSLALPATSHCPCLHEDRSVCVLSNEACNSSNENKTEASSPLSPCLHHAASNCPWLM